MLFGSCVSDNTVVQRNDLNHVTSIMKKGEYLVEKNDILYLKKENNSSFNKVPDRKGCESVCNKIKTFLFSVKEKESSLPYDADQRKGSAGAYSQVRAFIEERMPDVVSEHIDVMLEPIKHKTLTFDRMQAVFNQNLQVKPSRKLINKIMTELKLDSTPEFVGYLKQKVKWEGSLKFRIQQGADASIEQALETQIKSCSFDFLLHKYIEKICDRCGVDVSSCSHYMVTDPDFQESLDKTDKISFVRSLKECVLRFKKTQVMEFVTRMNGFRCLTGEVKQNVMDALDRLLEKNHGASLSRIKTVLDDMLDEKSPLVNPSVLYEILDDRASVSSGSAATIDELDDMSEEKAGCNSDDLNSSPCMLSETQVVADKKVSRQLSDMAQVERSSHSYVQLPGGTNEVEMLPAQ